MKRFLAIVCLATSILTSSTSAYARHYYFNKYTTQEGLPNNRIFNVVQDRFGFIWISTRDGICKFDGNEFVQVSITGSENLMTGDRMVMCVDEEGIIWFCSKDSVISYNPVTGEKKSLNLNRFDDKRVIRLASDGSGGIWCISSNSLFKYNKTTDEIVEFSNTDNPIPVSIVVDKFGTTWALTLKGEMFHFERKSESFKKIPIDGVLTIEPTSDGHILMNIQNKEIRLMDVRTQESEIIVPSNIMKECRTVYCMNEREPGEYWIGSEGGIVIYSRGRVTDFIRKSIEDKHALSSSHLTCMFSDRDGNVWIGTYYSGLNLWQNNIGSHIYYDYKGGNSLKGNVVRPIKSDKDGNIWVGTEDGELNRNNFQKHEMTRFPGNEQFNNIQGILPVNDEVWIASYGNGLIRYNPSQRRIVSQVQLSSGYATRLFQMSDGTILIGTRSGLFMYNEQDGTYKHIDTVIPHFIHSIFQDHRGNIWIGTLGRGIFILDSKLNLVSSIGTDNNDLIAYSQISSINEDSKHRIWITTEGEGVFFSKPEADIDGITFKNLRKEDGLASNVASAVAEDNDGHMWISTNHGITLYDPEKASLLTTFFSDSQITGCQFTQGSSCIINGSIFMGTSDGMLSFSPSILKDEIKSREMFITSIVAKGENRTTYLSEPGHSALTSQKISVKSKDISTLEINFSSPDYKNILDVEYQYFLSKKPEKANKLNPVRTNSSKAVFTSIKPGRYVFDVKMAGCNWEGTEKRLEIRVTPPLLLSMGAKAVYILLLLFVIWMITSLFSEKRKIDRKRSLSQLENEKQKEIYDAKIKYFTNITHEIRTPLSLIKMPVDKIIATEGYKSSAKEDMMTIQANTNRLLELSNQLLDLRKVEQKELKLIFTKEDISKTVIQTCDYFTAIAKERHIILKVQTPDTPVFIMCSAESIKKILTNLLSNAIKYGKDKIDVILSEDSAGNKISIRVNSNGARIDSTDRERIFEPFFQARMSNDQLHGSNGTGLGLPFAKSLAELHNGKLYLDIDVKDANSFVLELPIEQFNAIVIKEEDNKNESFIQSIDNSKHTILLVEDSLELRDYLGRELLGEYNIILATNGEEALKIVEKQKIDLVVSDIMMPVMDGCELCNAIKTNIDYCHIPVILLTAAVGVETRIETLKVGADGYIEKPFSIDLLKANISNIFKNKEISYRQFTQSPLSHYNGVVVNTIDDDFMSRLHSEVMKHLSEQDLNIEALTEILGTSKSTLYRKIKANTGLNINEYIRLCRLKEAAEMLSSQKYRINEVAYLVGFSSPSYFTTSFQKQFNISPSAFVKRIQQKD